MANRKPDTDGAPRARRAAKKAAVRGLGKLLDQEWWPLEVAIVWVATGDIELTKLAFGRIIERRAYPGEKHPSMGTWLMTYEGRATLYEATPGAMYRKHIRGNWKPGDLSVEHPWSRAMDETAAMLRKHVSSKRGRPRDTRRLARGKQRDEVEWIPTRAWSGVNLVDHRKWGMIIFADDHQTTGQWRDIDVSAEPFKALGADRGRQTIAQRSDSLVRARKNNERVRLKLAKHDAEMGRPAMTLRGRPKGSTNVRH
ncbi:hypothetical protein [Bradyrhizobium sp. Gha]|uniref:hypothetical protein n=1 Tax=Bradyrhizobium sp. Gha TaxID=1855318 RepID=UPI0008E852FB|nr:hypothetical protein [Bradyrhizobium sp. Gha]SFI39726.1 hypothetical protein SAMN05216525_10862 [Bradyrhizobium sp. Gha]